MMWLAMGAAYLTASDDRRALHSYRQARQLAQNKALPPAVMLQALLGLGTTHLTQNRFSDADETYADALRYADSQADAAPKVLCIELWRMRSLCALHLGDIDAAFTHAHHGLDVAAQLPAALPLPPPPRRFSSPP